MVAKETEDKDIIFDAILCAVKIIAGFRVIQTNFTRIRFLLSQLDSNQDLPCPQVPADLNLSLAALVKKYSSVLSPLVVTRMAYSNSY